MNSRRGWWFLPAAAVLAMTMGPSVISAQTTTPAPGSSGGGLALSVEEYTKDCVAKYEARDLVAALANCNHAVDAANGANVNGSLALALYDRGVVYYALEEFGKAITDYNAADKLTPHNRKILFARGVARYKIHEKDAAMLDYNESIALGIEDPTAYLDRGVLEFDNGDLADAERDYTRAIKMRRDYGNAYVNRAAERRKNESLHEKNRDHFELALEDYNKALEIDEGNDASTYYNRGTLRYEEWPNKKQDLEGAIDDFSKSIRLNANDPRVFYDLGVAYQQKADWANAITNYQMVVRLRSDAGQAYYNLASCEYQSGLYQESANDYSQALGVDPKWAEALHGRGLAHEKLAEAKSGPEKLPDLDLAINDYTQALALAPGNPAISFDRGVAYLRKFELDRKDRDLLTSAVQDYTAAINGKIDSAEVYYDRGYAHQRLREVDEAIADYTAALNKKPDHEASLRQRGEAYDAKAETLLKNGDQAGANAQFELALRDLDAAKSLRPNDPGVLDALGQAHYENGDYERAANDYQQEIQLRSNGTNGSEIEQIRTAEAYVNLGTVEFKQKRTEEAIRDYKTAIEKNSHNALAYCDLNAVYISLNQADQGAQFMSNAPQDASTTCKGQVIGESDLAGRKAFDSGDYQLAAQDYQTAINQDAKDELAHYGRGVALFESQPKDLPGAVTEFTTAISLNSKYLDAYNGLGLAYRAQGNLPDAEKNFHAALDISPNFPAALLNLAEALAAQQKWEEALVYYKKWAEPSVNRRWTETLEHYKNGASLKSDSAVAWEGSGLARYKNSDWDGAIADFNKALGFKSDSVGALVGLGDSFAQQGKWPPALEAYNKANGLKPNDPGILLDRGLAYDGVGDRKDARADYTAAIKLNRKYEIGYYDLAHVNLLQHRLAAALEDSSRADRLSDHSDAGALDVEGIAQGDERHLQSALADFNKALTLKPGDSDLLFNRAAVEVALNHFDEAIDDYNKVIEKRPDDAWAYYRRGIAYGARGYAKEVHKQPDATKDYAAAESDYNTAIAKKADFELAYANLWDLYRTMGEDEKAKAALEQAKRLKSEEDSKKVTPRP
jgi:tetratricopeptide (TPR) repeat protein